MSTNRTLRHVLGIRLPVLLAGMAGGSTTPELVAAVSEAGGLGVFGASGMRVDGVAAAVERACSLTSAPIGVNVLLGDPRPPEGNLLALADLADRYRSELGVAETTGPSPASALELVAAAIAAGARVVSVGLGDPAPVVEIARAAGVPVVAMVATVADAQTAVASGADVIVAQGAEAGGHRSNFVLPAAGEPLPLVGTMALVPQVVDAVSVPVVAAGGIADGRGLAAARALGAQGAQIGTRFLMAAESGVIVDYQQRLAAARDADTIITTALSGRPARGLSNRLIRELEALGSPSLGWPRQAGALAAIRRASEAAGSGELTSLWCGQAAGLASEILPAAEIVRQIMDEAAIWATRATEILNQ